MSSNDSSSSNGAKSPPAVADFAPFAEAIRSTQGPRAAAVARLLRAHPEHLTVYPNDRDQLYDISDAIEDLEFPPVEEFTKAANSVCLDDAVASAVVVPNDPEPCVLTIGDAVLPIPLGPGDDKKLHALLTQSAVGIRGVGDVVDTSQRSSAEMMIDKGPPVHDPQGSDQRPGDQPATAPSLDDADAGKQEAQVGPCVELPSHLRDFAFTKELEQIRKTLCPEAAAIRAVPYKLVGYAEDDFFKPHVDTPESGLHFGTLVVQLPTHDEYMHITHVDDTGGEILLHGGRCAHLDDPDGVPLTAKGRTRDLDAAYTNEGRGFGGYEMPKFGDTKAGSLERVIHFPSDRRPKAFHLKWTRSSEGKASSKGAVALSYAAWLTDVIHEVKPVKSLFRFVLTYKLFKTHDAVIRPHVPYPIPRALDSLFDKIRAASDLDATGVGILLRHQYPPGGLSPAALKGMDSVIYAACSQSHDCFLLPVFHCRNDYPSTPFRGEAAAGRKVFCPPHVPTTWGGEYLGQELLWQLPSLTKLVWVQLGLGELLGGGGVYGNADCGTDWWYSTTALVVVDRHRWASQRWAFAAAQRSGDATTRAALSEGVTQHVLASFLA